MVPAARLLESMAPGSLTAVVGRPGAGVSTWLAGICVHAAESAESGAVLASWERPASASARLVGREDVTIPQILNWDLAELERCPEIDDAGTGAVVAIDYLQLIDNEGDEAATALALHALAVERQFRVVLGVMARRELAELEGDVSPVRTARLVGQNMATLLSHADKAVVLAGTDIRSRRAVVTTPAPRNDATWLVHWTAGLDWDDEGHNE